MSEPETPAPPTDPPRLPLVERVAALEARALAAEDKLGELIARHNAFINTVIKELGL